MKMIKKPNIIAFVPLVHMKTKPFKHYTI